LERTENERRDVLCESICSAEVKMKSELFELPILICLYLAAIALFGDDGEGA
jgi:hypothetical protein